MSLLLLIAKPLTELSLFTISISSFTFYSICCKPLLSNETTLVEISNKLLFGYIQRSILSPHLSPFFIAPFLKPSLHLAYTTLLWVFPSLTATSSQSPCWFLSFPWPLEDRVLLLFILGSLPHRHLFTWVIISFNLKVLNIYKSIIPPYSSIQIIPPSQIYTLLLLPSILPSIRVLSNESVLHIRRPKYWSFSFNISPSYEYSGLIFFRIDWCDLLTVQGTLKSLLQHHSSKA